MSGNGLDSSSSANNGGSRRRRSAPQDDEENPFQSPEYILNAPDQPIRDFADPHTSSAGPSDTSSQPSSPRRRLGYEAGHHVRFSSDTGQASGPGGTFMHGAVPMATGSSSGIPPVPPSPRHMRRSMPDLFIDTRDGTKLSAGTHTRSPTSPTARSPEVGSSYQFSTPQSPRTRTRGYSLRRMVFNKVVDNTSGSVIELQNAGPSTSAASPREEPRPQKPKASETTVKIQALDGIEEEEKKPTTIVSKVPGLQGISALPHYEDWIREKGARTRGLKKIKALYNRARKIILQISDIPPSKDGRQFTLDALRKIPLVDERTNRSFVSNTIRSSRYTPYNFLPRQLFAQFSKLANFYFLIVSIVQMIPGLSTTGTYTTIIPLLFFVSISMAKEGYDDFRRARLDKEENNRYTSILHAYCPTEESNSEAESGGIAKQGLIRWADTKWKDVQVGDIVKIERDQAAPADLVLLHSYGGDGIAYIETMALDGETNLKSKQATPLLSRTCDTLEKLAATSAHIVVEDPNLDLYNFEGRAIVNSETSPMSNSSIIYRGSILRNTSEAYGVVVYSGEECKIRMNANKAPRIKAPSLQFVANKIVIIVVIFVIALALFNAVAYEIWAAKNLDKLWYLDNAGIGFAQIFVSFIILFNTMIPLSLYVSMEIIKVFQMLLLNDIDMYDEESNTPMEARTSTINEELGQISYIFSDKTGTLTDNSMKFRKLSVAGTAWLHDADLKAAAAKADEREQFLRKKRSKGKKPARRPNQFEFGTPQFMSSPPYSSVTAGPTSNTASRSDVSASGWKSSARPNKVQPELETVEMLRYMQRMPNTAFAKKARWMLLCIAVCNTCLPERQKDGSIRFQAASPDELALVEAAQDMGFLVIDRKSGVLSIETYPSGQDAEAVVEQFEILDVVEFSSKRKRMSVVVRLPDQRICIICKGADSIITQLLRLRTLALQKTYEIEHRGNVRRSMEAQQVLARKSEALDRKMSVAGRSSINPPRPSISAIGRPSISGFGRPSMSATRGPLLRDQLDGWLTEREHEPGADRIEGDARFYNPRPSFQVSRPSMATTDARPSTQVDADFELVEEVLVLDEPSVIERTFQHVNDFATEGLRTLLYAHRYISEEEYLAWKKIYRDAASSLLDRQARIEAAGELVERDLELAGATAIEDKLQKGVPEAIDKLRRAGIKMWMLTGDKRETAINIGHSCRLIKDYSTLTILDAEHGQPVVEQSIASAIIALNAQSLAHSVVVVDGATLALIEACPPLRKLFYDLATLTDSVLCCRASPSQKASLVRAVRHKVRHAITLAIGDGANDIAMIQEAHVGIGITGKEGLQAARTSDYSIAQFRFLVKLLLVHGRWNYIRTCRYIAATFWKEATFYLVQALYQRYNGFTGTSLYENWSLSLFNTLFTSLPVIFLGIFEKDLAPSTLIAVPELYTYGQRNAAFNLRVYLQWMALAAADAVIVFFSMYGFYTFSSAPSGHNNDLFALGDMCFTSVVVIVSLKLQLLEMHNRCLANFVAVFLSIGGWTVWNLLLAGIYHSPAPYAVRGALFNGFGKRGVWWLTLGWSICAVMALELGVKAVGVGMWAGDEDVFRQLEKDPGMRARFEEASRGELGQGWQASAEAEAGGGGGGSGKGIFGFLWSFELWRKKKGHEGEVGMDVGVRQQREQWERENEEQVSNQAEREREVAEMLKRRGVVVDGREIDNGESSGRGRFG